MLSGDWLHHHEHKLERYLAERVLALVCELPGHIAVLGSGSLVKLRSGLFLVTARHVAEAMRSASGHGRLAVRTRDGHGLIPLPSRLDWNCPAAEDALDADVCALPLDRKLARRLQQSWTPLADASFAHAGALAQQPEVAYLIAGYPAAATAAPGLLTVYTRRLTTAPAAAMAPVHPRFDWFFEYARRARDSLTGNARHTPELEGVSGAPVWHIVPGKDSASWMPERGLRVVGIQSSYLHSSFIRAKDWSLVSPLLQNL